MLHTSQAHSGRTVCINYALAMRLVCARILRTIEVGKNAQGTVSRALQILVPLNLVRKNSSVCQGDEH